MSEWKFAKPALDDETECGRVVALVDDDGAVQFSSWLERVIEKAGAKKDVWGADSAIDLLFNLGISVYVMEEGEKGELRSLFIGATTEDPKVIEDRASVLL